MGGSTKTYDTQSARTRDFQEFLYNTITGSLAQKPNVGNIDYGSISGGFTPSSLSRTAGNQRSAQGPSSGYTLSPRVRNTPVGIQGGGGTGYDLYKRYLNGRAPSPDDRNVGIPDYTGIPGNAQTMVGAGSGGRTAQPRPDTGGWWAGTAPDDGALLSQIFASLPNFNGMIPGIPDLPQLQTASATAATIRPPKFGSVARRPGEDDASYQARQAAFDQEMGNVFSNGVLSPTIGTLGRHPGESEGEYNARAAQFNQQQALYNSMIGSVQKSAQSLMDPKNAFIPDTVTARDTQSADQIALDAMGENSMFTKNILPAYNNLFNQTNALTAAAAKESAGNLTGSGFANTLGSALNRNNATQQQTLANVLNSLVSQEIGRQEQGAALNLQGQTTSAQLKVQAEQLRQQGIATGNESMLQAANQLAQKAQTQAQLELQASIATQDSWDKKAMLQAQMENQINLANAGFENDANNLYFNAGVNRNQRMTELLANANMGVFNQAAGMNQFNAQQFSQIMQMLFGGGQPNTVVRNPGIAGALPGIGSILGAVLPFFL